MIDVPLEESGGGDMTSKPTFTAGRATHFWIRNACFPKSRRSPLAPDLPRGALARGFGGGGRVAPRTGRLILLRKRVVFHIGLAKTGTTSFQHQCHRHRGHLARQGILYPRAVEGFARNHSPLAASYLAHRPRDPTIALKIVSRARAVERLTAEINASPCPVALVSSEHLSLHFDTHEAYQLAADFDRFDPTIVVVLREPYGRFLSMWNTHVTAGGRLSLEEFALSILVPDNRYFSIREILRVWRAAFVPERVRIVAYEDDVGAAILRLCGMETTLPQGRRRRASLPLATIASLRAVNAAIAAQQTAPSDSLAAWAQLSAFSVLARTRLARKGPDVASPLVSPQTMEALDMIWENDRAWLAETYGFALASTRSRYIVGNPQQPKDEQRSADEIYRQVSRGLWTPSQALVAAFEWARGRR